MTSGLIRPSAEGPRLLKSATSSRPGPLKVAPAAITFFASANGFIVWRPGGTPQKPEPQFPAAKTTRKSWLFQMKLSVSADSWIYALQQLPQLSEWIEEFRFRAICQRSVTELKLIELPSAERSCISRDASNAWPSCGPVVPFDPVASPLYKSIDVHHAGCAREQREGALGELDPHGTRLPEAENRLHAAEVGHDAENL